MVCGFRAVPGSDVYYRRHLASSLKGVSESLRRRLKMNKPAAKIARSAGLIAYAERSRFCSSSRSTMAE